MLISLELSFFESKFRFVVYWYLLFDKIFFFKCRYVVGIFTENQWFFRFDSYNMWNGHFWNNSNCANNQNKKFPFSFVLFVGNIPSKFTRQNKLYLQSGMMKLICVIFLAIIFGKLNNLKKAWTDGIRRASFIFHKEYFFMKFDIILIDSN